LPVADEGQSLMRAAMAQLNLSARAYHRTQSVKLARTIADLAEALHLRQTEVDVGVGGVVIIYSAESPGREGTFNKPDLPITNLPIPNLPITNHSIPHSTGRLCPQNGLLMPKKLVTSII